MRIRFFPALAAVFIGMTLLDSLLLYLLGRYIGFWTTVAIIFASGFLGAALVRSQVRRVWRTIRADLGEGRVPSQGVLDGAIILVAGGLLAAPGFLTDLLGLLLLLPPVRVPIKRWLRRRAEVLAHQHLGIGPRAAAGRVEDLGGGWR